MLEWIAALLSTRGEASFCLCAWQNTLDEDCEDGKAARFVYNDKRGPSGQAGDRKS